MSRGWPEWAPPPGARRTTLTGTQVYEALRCPHAVHLEFFADPARKLPPTAEQAWLRACGRRHEERLMAVLGPAVPEYPPGDFAAGAAATRRLLEEGVPLIAQGVLRQPPYLGIPDLLRRTSEPSALGEYSYEVGDVKSSLSPRADQALQVAFYSRLLGGILGRPPERAFLILGDGSEEAVPVAELMPVLDEVLAELSAGPLGPGGSRPHAGPACRGCGWRRLCAEEARGIEAVLGPTRAERALMQGLGYDRLEALAWCEPRRLARKTPLSEAAWRRARLGARALLEGRAVAAHRPRCELRGRPRAVLAFEDPGAGAVLAWAAADPRGGQVFAGGAEAFAAFAGAVEGADTLLAGAGFAGALDRLVLRRPEFAEKVRRLGARVLDVEQLARSAFAFPKPVRTPAEMLAWLAPPGAEARPEDEYERLVAEAEPPAAVFERDGGAGLETRARAELTALTRLWRAVEAAAQTPAGAEKAAREAGAP